MANTVSFRLSGFETHVLSTPTRRSPVDVKAIVASLGSDALGVLSQRSHYLSDETSRAFSPLLTDTQYYAYLSEVTTSDVLASLAFTLPSEPARTVTDVVVTALDPSTESFSVRVTVPTDRTLRNEYLIAYVEASDVATLATTETPETLFELFASTSTYTDLFNQTLVYTDVSTDTEEFSHTFPQTPFLSLTSDYAVVVYMKNPHLRTSFFSHSVLASFTPQDLSVTNARCVSMGDLPSTIVFTMDYDLSSTLSSTTDLEVRLVAYESADRASFVDGNDLFLLLEDQVIEIHDHDPLIPATISSKLVLGGAQAPFEYGDLVDVVLQIRNVVTGQRSPIARVENLEIRTPEIAAVTGKPEYVPST